MPPRVQSGAAAAGAGMGRCGQGDRSGRGFRAGAAEAGAAGDDGLTV